MEHKLYLNDKGNAYAVLVSHGFGAGFSTWNEKWMAYDRRVVEYWLAHKDNEQWMHDVHYLGTAANKEALDFFNNEFGIEPYLGGFNDIELHWVRFNVAWEIKEYDGAETLEFMKDVDWTIFYKE